MEWLDTNAKWFVALGVLAAIATIIGTLYTIGIIHPQDPALPATPPVAGRASSPVVGASSPVVVTPTPDYSVREINNNEISYTGSCGYNHGLSPSLYNDDVEICEQQNDSFTYTFMGTSIYLVTVYYQNHGGTISCYIDNSFTQSFNLDSSSGVDVYGLAYGIVLPIAPKLVYTQHTAFCQMTSASGKYFFVDVLIINK